MCIAYSGASMQPDQVGAQLLVRRSTRWDAQLFTTETPGVDRIGAWTQGSKCQTDSCKRYRDCTNFHEPRRDGQQPVKGRSTGKHGRDDAGDPREQAQHEQEAVKNENETRCSRGPGCRPAVCVGHASRNCGCSRHHPQTQQRQPCAASGKQKERTIQDSSP